MTGQHERTVSGELLDVSKAQAPLWVLRRFLVDRGQGKEPSSFTETRRHISAAVMPRRIGYPGGYPPIPQESGRRMQYPGLRW